MSNKTHPFDSNKALIEKISQATIHCEDGGEGEKILPHYSTDTNQMALAVGMV